MRKCFHRLGNNFNTKPMSNINNVKFCRKYAAVYTASPCKLDSTHHCSCSVNSLTLSTTKQLTICKSITHTTQHINSPCSVITKLPYTAYSMILHLPYAMHRTWYDKLIIYHTQHMQRLTYHNSPYLTCRVTSNYAN